MISHGNAAPLTDWIALLAYVACSGGCQRESSEANLPLPDAVGDDFISVADVEAVAREEIYAREDWKEVEFDCGQTYIDREGVTVLAESGSGDDYLARLVTVSFSGEVVRYEDLEADLPPDE